MGHWLCVSAAMRVGGGMGHIKGTYSLQEKKGKERRKRKKEKKKVIINHIYDAVARASV